MARWKCYDGFGCQAFGLHRESAGSGFWSTFLGGRSLCAASQHLWSRVQNHQTQIFLIGDHKWPMIQGNNSYFWIIILLMVFICDTWGAVTVEITFLRSLLLGSSLMRLPHIVSQCQAQPHGVICFNVVVAVRPTSDDWATSYRKMITIERLRHCDPPGKGNMFLYFTVFWGQGGLVIVNYREWIEDIGKPLIWGRWGQIVSFLMGQQCQIVCIIVK